MALTACGGGGRGEPSATTPANSAPTHSPATPIGGWTSATGPLGPMILCVVDHGFGVTKMKGDRDKRAAKAAGIAVSKACTWADDGTGHCTGSGMHSDFDLTWKLSGDELTLSPPSDLMRDPVTFKRDASIDCSHPAQVAPEPDSPATP